MSPLASRKNNISCLPKNAKLPLRKREKVIILIVSFVFSGAILPCQWVWSVCFGKNHVVFLLVTLRSWIHRRSVGERERAQCPRNRTVGYITSGLCCIWPMTFDRGEKEKVTRFQSKQVSHSSLWVAPFRAASSIHRMTHCVFTLPCRDMEDLRDMRYVDLKYTRRPRVH